MIIIPVQVDVVNHPENAVEAYWEQVEAFIGSCCPLCGQSLVKCGRYWRKTPACIGPFLIQVVACSAKTCESREALLPSFIPPYGRSFVENRQQAIEGVLEDRETREKIAEQAGVEVSTVGRWWTLFTQCANRVLDFLQKELADADLLATWTKGPIKTVRDKGKKVFELLQICREAFFPELNCCALAIGYLMQPRLFCPLKEE